MGTWEAGLLDNDTAMDGLGDLRHGVAEDIERFGAMKPSVTATGKLAGAVGVLLQLSAYDFGLDTPTGPKIVAALGAHSAAIAKLPSAARKLLQAVAAGEGKALAERPAKMAKKHIQLLHTGASKAPFGPRERALFESKAALAYVQEVAKRCIELVDGDFEDEENWSDLCREGMGMGALAALLVLEPVRLSAAKVEGWRRKAQKGLATLEAKPNDELDFFRVYYARLDAVLALLAERARKIRAER